MRLSSMSRRASGAMSPSASMRSKGLYNQRVLDAPGEGAPRQSTKPQGRDNEEIYFGVDRLARLRGHRARRGERQYRDESGTRSAGGDRPREGPGDHRLPHQERQFKSLHDLKKGPRIGDATVHKMKP